MPEEYANTPSDTARDDKKLLEKLDKWFKYSVDHPSWKRAKENMLKCFQYREGDQWTPSELATMDDRSQPPTVNNQIAVTINKLIGDLTDRKARTGFKGRNEPADAEIAAALTDIFLYIRQSNDLEFEEVDMADDGFTSGFGVMEVYVTFDDLFQPTIKVRQEDSLIVFPDPDSRRYDWNDDARFIFRAKWFDADELEEKYPAAKNLAANEAGAASDTGVLNAIDTFRNEYYFDEKRKKIRIIDGEYRTFQKEEIYFIVDPDNLLPATLPKEEGDKIKAEAEKRGAKFEPLTRMKKGITRCVFAGGRILEKAETSQKYYSLVPYFMYRRKDGGPYSLITLSLSLQDAINKRESKAQHLLNTNQTIAENTALLDKEEFAEELAKPDGIAIVADGALVNQRVLLRNNIELASSQYEMHKAAQISFQQVTGVNPAAAFDTGELRGNAALKSKFSEAGKPVARIFENLRRTRTILARVLLDKVQTFITAEQTMLITDNENKAKTISLSKEMVQRIKTAQYDAVVEDMPDVTNIHQEQFALMLQYLPQILPHGPFWTKFLLKASDLRDKEEMVAELDKMSGPPPVQPRISIQGNIDKLPPIERAKLWELMGDPELAQMVRDADIMTSDELESTVELAKVKIQAQAKAFKEKSK